MNTFVHTSPYGIRGHCYRVATYVKSRNGRPYQFKCLSGFLSYREATELAQKMSRSH